MAEMLITEHVLVPKHEIVPKERVKEVLEAYGADINQLPQILKTDPVIAEIGAKKGDLIKITRKSRTAGKAVYYRIVV